MEWLQACACCLLHCLPSIYSAWMSGFLPPSLPECLLIHQSPCVCLSLSGQLFVHSVYYLYSTCISVVQLFSVSSLTDSLPLTSVCMLTLGASVYLNTSILLDVFAAHCLLHARRPVCFNASLPPLGFRKKDEAAATPKNNIRPTLLVTI